MRVSRVWNFVGNTRALIIDHDNNIVLLLYGVSHLSNERAEFRRLTATCNGIECLHLSNCRSNFEVKDLSYSVLVRESTSALT